jgi:hypothetical protein
MGHCETYIVRVYRRAGEDPDAIVGIVEVPATDLKMAFHGLAELVALLALPSKAACTPEDIEGRET